MNNPLFPPPRFVSGTEEVILFDEDGSTIASREVPSDESNFNRYDNMVTDLDNLIGGAINNINNSNYTNIHATPRPPSVSQATK